MNETIEELIGNLIVAAAKMEPMGDAYNALLARFEQLEIACHEKDDLVQATLNSLAALREENKALKVANRWIPVGERLPEDDVWVLATAENTVFPAAHSARFEQHWYLELSRCLWGSKITHWRPLPEPPEVTNG
jgi:hypothetical protein